MHGGFTPLLYTSVISLPFKLHLFENIQRTTGPIFVLRYVHLFQAIMHEV